MFYSLRTPHQQHTLTTLLTTIGKIPKCSSVFLQYKSATQQTMLVLMQLAKKYFSPFFGITQKLLNAENEKKSTITSTQQKYPDTIVSYCIWRKPVYSSLSTLNHTLYDDDTQRMELKPVYMGYIHSYLF